jgi:mannonate dehydratase
VPIRVALGQVPGLTDEYIAYAQQLGVPSIHVNTPALPGTKRWEVADLLALRQRAEAAGLRLEAIENVPNSFYMDAMLGRPGRDEEIENFQATIRNFGAAGIGLFGFHFFPVHVWRTSEGPDGRGGAIVTGFDAAIATDPRRRDDVLVAHREKAQDDPFVKGAHFEVDRELDDDAMWANFEYFIRAVIPVAEEAGVRLCLHPDDPPVPTLGGVARLFRSVAALRRARELASSRAFAFDLCLGTVSEMGGSAAVLEAIDTFGPSGDIAYLHMRDVKGTVPTFRECFLGEGNYDPAEVIRRLHGMAFDGFLIDDHVPRMIDDTPYCHRGRAQAVGYLQGLVQAITGART